MKKESWLGIVLVLLVSVGGAYASTVGDRMKFEGPVTITGSLTTSGAVTSSGAQTFTGTLATTSTATMEGINYSATESGTDAYTATLAPVPTEYQIGMFVAFAAYTGNTGAATLNVNSLGAKPIVKLNDQALSNQCLESGMIALSFYDGTSFQLVNPCAN